VLGEMYASLPTLYVTSFEPNVSWGL